MRNDNANWRSCLVAVIVCALTVLADNADLSNCRQSGEEDVAETIEFEIGECLSELRSPRRRFESQHFSGKPHSKRLGFPTSILAANLGDSVTERSRMNGIGTYLRI